jgi:tetraacyldisaccharide 4'-kinase
MTQPTNSRRFLQPLTPIYRAALAVRELRLRSGLEQVRKLELPVVSIGSVSAGGSGKTPLTIALARALTLRGLKINVLSRGYGRSSMAALRVDPDGVADEFGDEPLLIARESGAPVYVAAQRFDAGLLAESAREADSPTIHLLDDGYQHRQLHRDVNILLLDEHDLHDRMLPAGNLREPLRAIRRAHAVVIPAGSAETNDYLKRSGWQGQIWEIRRRIQVPLIDGPVVAFCGIARSDQFFAGLESDGMHLASRIAFADHHRYLRHDIDCILEAAKNINAAACITTEKDRVRLGKLAAAFPASRPLKTAQLTIEIENEDAALSWILERISNRSRR